MLRPELDYGCHSCATCFACTDGIHSSCYPVRCTDNGTYHNCACTHLPVKDAA